MPRILFVDDDEMLLKAVRRSLGSRFELDVAVGPIAALEKMNSDGPYAVVVSDLKMPVMDGISLLSKVRKLSPDTVRVILTGFADLDNAVDAVNRGEVYRFLTKPCEDGILSEVLQNCLRQYLLVTAERELLEKTLKGCVAVLTETLSLVNPEAFGRAARVARFTTAIAKQADCEELWKYEVAAMLSQIGCVILPEKAMLKLAKGQKFDTEEQQLFDMHPIIGRNLLARIPRMEDVADMVAYQEKNFDGSGIPLDGMSGEDIPLGARILRVAIDFDLAYSRVGTFAKAFAVLEEQIERYDPVMLYYLEGCLGREAHYDFGTLLVKELRSGMVMDQAVSTLGGLHLLRKGRELTPVLVTKLRAVHERVGVGEPIKVLIPANMPQRDLADIVKE
ncbi:MAG: HD domain-containing phosphohydrolase [Desulfovibrionaceae bacterium]